MFPYLDIAGFKRRSVMVPTDVDALESLYPGFVAARVALQSSFINSRLRKRYGNAGQQNSLPLGQTAPALVAAGTSPPGVSLTGRPILGSLQVILSIDGAGGLTVATFKWSPDGGLSWSTGVTTASAVALAGTGMSANFSVGSYSTDNVYAAATPVPEAVLGWLVALVTRDAFLRRGMNPQDPAMQMIVDECTVALADLKEAADSTDGLFDLPASEDLDSAVTTGGPQFYSETSPYVFADLQRQQGTAEDSSGRGRS